MCYDLSRKIMDYISENDIYEIRIASLVSNVDKDVIVELYQPLIGCVPTILYLTLLKQKRNEDDDSIVFTHKDLLSLMQIQPGVLYSARRSLEGVGLLRTFEKKGKDGSYLIYVLYAPKNPKEFFDDVLFKGLLIQSIGEKEARRLASHYHVDSKMQPSFKEISASFVDIFNPNYDDKSFKEDFGNDIVGHEVGRIVVKFSYDLFFKYVEDNSQIQRTSFSKKDMLEIERLATFFSLNEQTIASIIIDVFDPFSKQHIDFVKATEEAKEKVRFPLLQKKRGSKTKISSSSLVAQKVGLMEQKSPVEFLSLLQGNTRPATSDINIANMLSENYGFPNGIINVILDYTLEKNNNILSRNYCEKIAASIKREQIDNTLDTMNFLNNFSNSNKATKKTVIVENKNDNSNKQDADASQEVSDEELNDLLKDINSLKK